MTPFADPHVIYALISLAWFSLTDLRYRTAPGVELFFWGAVLLGAFANPLRVGVVTLALSWGWGNWSSFVMLPLLFHPSIWIVLLAGAGYREWLIGGADLMALAGIACLFDWYVPVWALIGVLVWREWWTMRWSGPVPALPGMFFGVILGSFIQQI